MLMLCLVFAVAGPVMPGAGDVSPMDPTIAYGAAPTMLVFAPDGGAGFDLMGQEQSQGTPQLASTVVCFMFWHPRWSRTLPQ